MSDSPLEHIARLASRAGIERIADEADSLAMRVSEGRFYLACVGQFKRGKSTVLDALLGEQILPVGVLPVTALPTIVRHGPEVTGRVMGRDREWRPIRAEEIASYVSEAENPENQKGIVAVEVFLPSDLLATGLCLVDTPGIGSIFEANSRATYEFLPHIDAALVVLGADPPITGEELKLVSRINDEVDDLLFVLNKADRVSESELLAARDFACSALGERLSRPIEIYEVSAKEKLEGTGEGREWERLTMALDHLVSSSGRRLVWLAQQRGAERISAWLLTAIEQEMTALTAPIEQVESAMNELNDFIERAEEAIRDLDFRLAREQQLLMARLEKRRQQFIASALPAAAEKLGESAGGGPAGGPSLRRFAAEKALSVAWEEVIPWLEEETETVDEEYRTITERFTAFANDLLARLARAGLPQLAHIAESVENCGRLSSHSQFQFNRLANVGTPASPFRHAGDVLLSAVGMSHRIWRDAEEYLERLIGTNTSRVHYDLDRRLDEARKELAQAIRRELGAARDVAQATLLRARQTKAAGEEKVRGRLARLAEVERQVDKLREAISGSASVLRRADILSDERDRDDQAGEVTRANADAPA